MDSSLTWEVTTQLERERAGRTPVSLATLRRGATATVVSVGRRDGTLSALDRRLLELGFIAGEELQVIAEARPSCDPFVVRIGTTALALRRREVETVWVSQPDDR